MTATPIPRTLALARYGDLDTSTLRELPRGRQPIETRIVAGERARARAYEQLREELRAGRQAFVVCPLVEEAEDDGADARPAPARTGARRCARRPPSSSGCARASWRAIELALLHGGMRPREKQEAMAAFASGEADVLVATTVIEVGIDVPNATVMLVENAERFGISQLHQLRGRVGRGEHRSRCLLVGPPGLGAAAGAGRARRRLPAGRDRPRAAQARASWSARASPGSASSGSRGCPRTRRCWSARARAPRRSLARRPASSRAPEHALLARRARATLRRARRSSRSPAERRRAYGAAHARDRGTPRRPAAEGAARARHAADLRPRARGAVLDARRRSRARACSTCSRARGALGIEALSRGAARAVFVERDARARCARCARTWRRSGSAEPRPRCAAGTRSRRCAAARERGETYDLVFIDPPYSQARELGARAVGAAAAAARARRRAWSSRATGGRRSSSALAVERERRYGDTSITIHRHR